MPSTAARLAVIPLLAAFLASCASPARRPPVADRRPDPRVAVDVTQSASEQVVVVTTNTGGWSVALDRVYEPDEAHDAHAAFITARRPDPGSIVTQALVEHRLPTGVRPGEPLEVFLRVAGSDGPDPDQTYTRRR